MSEFNDYKCIATKRVDESTQMCVRISTKTRAKLDYLSGIGGVSVSTVVRYLVDKQLQDYEWLDAQFCDYAKGLEKEENNE